MANYITRVELHSASYQDYETLHAQMQQRGYARTVVGNGGTTYQLPTGTYMVTDTNASLQQAYDAAHAEHRRPERVAGLSSQIGQTQASISRPRRWPYPR